MTASIGGHRHDHAEHRPGEPGRTARLRGRSRDFLRQRAQGAAQFLARYGLLLGFLLLWQVASRAGWINAAVLPPLDTIAAALWNGLAGGALLDDVAISLQRAGMAFAAAVVIGIPLGLFMGQIGRSKRRSIPSCSSSARPRRWRSTRSSSCCSG